MIGADSVFIVLLLDPVMPLGISSLGISLFGMLNQTTGAKRSPALYTHFSLHFYHSVSPPLSTTCMSLFGVRSPLKVAVEGCISGSSICNRALGHEIRPKSVYNHGFGSCSTLFIRPLELHRLRCGRLFSLHDHVGRDSGPGKSRYCIHPRAGGLISRLLRNIQYTARSLGPSSTLPGVFPAPGTREVDGISSGRLPKYPGERSKMRRKTRLRDAGALKARKPIRKLIDEAFRRSVCKYTVNPS
jgi:hypothetical protein